MKYQVASIISDVRKVLDENSTAEKLTALSDTETLDLDAIIKSVIEDAARCVEAVAPLALVDYCVALNADNSTEWSMEWSGELKATVKLPSDFLRMVALRLDCFAQPLYEFIGVEDPRYRLQASKYAVHGTFERPVAAIVREAGKPLLEVYTTRGGKTQEYIGDYLPVPTIADNAIELCERCYKAIVYRCAGMTMVIYKDANAENVLKLADTLMV